MTVAVNRRSIMTLFSDPAKPESHWVRLVLAEKGVTSLETVYLHGDEVNEDLMDLNPYSSVPTLVDRELVLYHARIITEYLDERFPHPPLMPVDPALRARSRLALYRIEQDLYSRIETLEHGDKKEARQARKRLREALVTSANVFAAKPYFLSDEFSLVDCSLAPILWRLEYYDVELLKEANPIRKYAQRVFDRPSFQHSLTESERELRTASP